MKQVSFQGERGAFSEAAAQSFFHEEKIETFPFSHFSEVLLQTQKGHTTHSILPLENSLEGSVGESYDLLYSTSLYVVGETYYNVRHCLIGLGTLDEITEVHSHPQALGQCRQFIETKKWQIVPVYDTAGSVKMIKERNQKSLASIASQSAAEIYRMPIIEKDIQDHPHNYTRFLILAQNQYKDNSYKETQALKKNQKNVKKKILKQKTSLIFSVQHKFGALFKVIEKFYIFGVNLTKIESRPKKTNLGEYYFFLDFEGSLQDERISKMLEKVKKETFFMKVLGSYPADHIFSPSAHT